MSKTFLALSVLLAAAAASAQTFEARVADASSQARLGIQGLPTTYAKSIVCADPPAAAYLPKDLKFYTHLDGKPVTKLPVDDTASRLNDYRGAGVRDGKWHYDAWSCDTTDYWFEFRMSDLVRGSNTETSRAIKGRVKVETRGQTDFEGDLDCVAYW
ncbi:MAG: hypothetical protein HY079_11450 [Elusimicrobia bacterium]|nr:hypothetical protein [Elusimicrobiota bacterium]